MIAIQPIQPEDADTLYEATRESIVPLTKWMHWAHPDYSLDEARHWVELQRSARQEKREFNFSIRGDDQRLLGVCGLHRIDWPQKTAELGYWVRPSAQNQGIATEAVRHLAEYAFEELMLHRLEFIIDVENGASQSVAEKAGATHEGVLRERLVRENRRRDAVLYSMIGRMSSR